MNKQPQQQPCIRIGIGGLRRNVDDLLNQMATQQEFFFVDQPSLMGKQSVWRLIQQIWRYTGDIDLYYGIGYGQWLRYLFAYLRGIPTVCHWAGTDVWRVRHRWPHRIWFQFVIRHCITRHLAVAEHLQAELHEVGVDAGVIPLLSDLSEASVLALPKRFTVLAYLPISRGTFYRAEMIYTLAKQHPDWEFLIVGRGTTTEGAAIDNVSELGHVAMSTIYPQVSVLIRTPVHDGLPRMVLEAMSWGRYVIYSHLFPHTYHATAFRDIEGHLLQLSTTQEPNDAGAAYVAATYSTKKMVALLLQEFRNIVKP